MHEVDILSLGSYESSRFVTLAAGLAISLKPGGIKRYRRPMSPPPISAPTQ